MRLTIVILNYRTPELVIDCLQSLSNDVVNLDGVYVVVLDNASGDQSPVAIQEAIDARGWSAWCAVHQAQENRGFSAGNNAGMALRDSELYLLLNSDTLVHEGALSSLLEAAEAYPDAGLIGPKLVSAEGVTDTSCFRIPGPMSELVRGAHLSVIDRLLPRHVVACQASEGCVESQWISFAAVLLRRKAMMQVGPMDEGFFMYFEDIDYCRRMLKAGWKIVFWPKAVITHLGGGSISETQKSQGARPRGPRYFYEARARYFCKYYGIVMLWAANVLWTMGKGLSLLRQWTSGRPSHCRVAEYRDIWIRGFRPLHPPTATKKDGVT